MKILYEDNHLLVVNKPALLPTMGVSEEVDSLVKEMKDYLRHKYHKPGNVFLGVVSRLDSWVSGVVVFARTSKSAERLNRQFRERTCRKVYLAIVPDLDGFPLLGRLEDQLTKNDSLKRMVIAPSGSRRGVQSASLSFRTLGRQAGKRLLEIELKTGRKHQIRIQLSAAGCPIAGDRKYGSELHFPVGIALHSLRLEIEHPTQKTPLAFQANPPAYWNLDKFGRGDASN